MSCLNKTSGVCVLGGERELIQIMFDFQGCLGGKSGVPVQDGWGLALEEPAEVLSGLPVAENAASD